MQRRAGGREGAGDAYQHGLAGGEQFTGVTRLDIAVDNPYRYVGQLFTRLDGHAQGPRIGSVMLRHTSGERGDEGPGGKRAIALNRRPKHLFSLQAATGRFHP
jgi:hypothetical protein